MILGTSKIIFFSGVRLRDLFEQNLRFLILFGARTLGEKIKEVHFLWYLALDITANCICEIHCLALDGFDLNSVHKLSSKDKKSQQSRDPNPGLLGGKQGYFLCAKQPRLPHLRKEVHKYLKHS